MVSRNLLTTPSRHVSTVPEVAGECTENSPLGHPVMRMTMLSFLRPFSSRIVSILSTRTGRYRSDSAIARPHVGKATHADDERRRPEKSTLSSPYFLSSLAMVASSDGSISEIMRCWFAVRRKTPLCTFAISRRPVLKSLPGSSCTRPFSMKHVKCFLPSHPVCQPKVSMLRSNL